MGMLWSFQGSPEDNILIVDVKQHSHQESKFGENHSTWPMLANREVLDLIDYSLPSYKPWPNVSECAHFENRFAVTASFIPPVYLASFPGERN